QQVPFALLAALPHLRPARPGRRPAWQDARLRPSRPKPQAAAPCPTMARGPCGRPERPPAPNCLPPTPESPAQEARQHLSQGKAPAPEAQGEAYCSPPSGPEDRLDLHPALPPRSLPLSPSL